MSQSQHFAQSWHATAVGQHEAAEADHALPFLTQPSQPECQLVPTSGPEAEPTEQIQINY